MDNSKELIFKEQIKKSFLACKEDIKSNQEQIASQSEVLTQILDQLKDKDSQIENLSKQLLQSQKLIQQSLEEIKSLKENQLHQKDSQVISKATEMPTQQKERKEKKEQVNSKDSYEALLEFKAKLNKREVLKQKLKEIISADGMVLSELKFLFVEHFKYCSKATFYNYLKELELSKQIRIERENAKNMVYLSGQVSSQNEISTENIIL